MLRIRRLVGALVAMAIAAIPPAAAEDFIVENAFPGIGFNLPTAFAFAPDGRVFVTEKRGVVRVVAGGVKQVEPVWDGQREVLNSGDRGLIGIALDPDFARTRRLYLVYSVDPDSDGVEDDDDAFGRVTRYTVSEQPPFRVDPASRRVLIGATWSDGIPSGSTTHAVGSLRFGADGSLLVSCGDGAQYAGVDSGGRDPGLFVSGAIDPAEDLGAFRAQSLGSLAGKILRIHPETGHGYASNPYADGSLTSRRARVWAYGLRNPFRFCLRPGTGASDTALGDPGVLAIGDVGWDTREEIDVAARPGMNFGWPCFEGDQPQPLYARVRRVPFGCGAGSPYEGPAIPEAPAVAWHHTRPDSSMPPGVVGDCAVGGVFYSGTRYPQRHRGSLFFADFGEGWIRVARFSEDHRLIATEALAQPADGPVDFGVDPAHGDVHYLALYTGTLRRIRYDGVLDVPGRRPAAALSPAVPNPTRSGAAFTLGLSRPGSVGFAVLDLAGRTVWEAAPRHAFGPVRLDWPGTDARGRAVPAGVYLARATFDGGVATRRCVVLR